MKRRVIGAEHVQEAAMRGRRLIEVMPGDIVTGAARDSAERMQVTLANGPLPKPQAIETDGATAARRVLLRRSPRWISPKPRVRSEPKQIARMALIGAGGVGATVAHLAANAALAREIVLIDVMPGLAEAVALDLNHAAGITRSSARAVGGTDLGLVRDADIIVVSAGRPRTPGMSRADLLEVNRRVIIQAAEAIRVHAPEAVVIVVTNPLDEMTAEMLRATGFPRARVLGMAGALDSSRFRRALAEAAGVPVADVEAMTLGSHGEEMAPIVSRARIRGRAVSDVLSAEVIAACVRNAVGGGAAVVALRKTGSATLAPAHAIIEMIDHMRGARAGTLPVSVALQGEYGIDGVVLGVPCHLGMGGLVAVEELPLDAEELAQLKRAADAIKARLG
jgi:malate dehydrogenase